MSVVFTDNSAQYLAELDRAINASLEAIGEQCSGYAKDSITAAGRIATDTMRGTISHEVQGDTVYIGTNTRYAIYHELGTGVYIAGGRQSPWAYKDAKGNWHMTRGVRPLHFLKNSVANHLSEIKAIIIKYFKGG